MQDINAIIHNLLDVRETLELYRDAIGAQWIDDAIAALREKEPVKPEKHFLDIGMVWYSCGNCGHHIFRGTNAKYCDVCGRAVRWT